MNSRAKTLFGLVVLGLCIFQFYSPLTQADELNWQVLKTEKVEVQDYSSGQGEVISSYPPFLQGLFRRVINWDPRKELKKSPTPASAEYKVSLTELFRNLSVDFDLSDTQHFRKAWFHLTPTLKVRGLFGIHDFQKSRPLVILRMGIHGNVDELFAERFIAKAIYEDLDMNFLILENLTSHAFFSENKEISIGGVEEGLHTFLIMNYLTDSHSAFNPLINEVYLVGVSLGAQGTFVTALMDSVNRQRIKSVLDMCPLINLKDTFDFHAQPGFKNAIVDLWNYHRMKILNKRFEKQLADVPLYKIPFDQKPRFVPRLMQILESERAKPLLTAAEIQGQVSNLTWPKGFYELLTNSKSFYELNDFWKFYQGVKIPFLVYTTPTDPLVVNELNGELIFSGKQSGDFKSLKFKRLDRGLHCGLAPVFSWDQVVSMIKDGLVRNK